MASPGNKSMSPLDALVHYSKCLLENEKTEILDYSSVINNNNDYYRYISLRTSPIE